MSIVIAFGHRKQVGKDTAAKYLATIIRTETRGLSLKTCGFADELKDQCHRLYGWAGLKCREYYEENQKEKSAYLEKIGKTVRQVWIDYGTLVGRAIYQYTWIDFLFNLPGTPDIVLIKDMRFINEFERVRQNGGLLCKVENPRVPYTDDDADRPLLGLPDSEWNLILHNDGTLQDLYSAVQTSLWPAVKSMIPANRLKKEGK